MKKVRSQPARGQANPPVHSSAQQQVLAMALILVVATFAAWIVTEIGQVRYVSGVAVDAASLAAAIRRAAWIQGITMAVTALVVVSGTWYLNKRHTTGSNALRADVEADRVRFAKLSTDVRETAYAGEDAGRRLTSQVGETLASIAQIASQSVDTSGRVSNLSDQVAEGASAVEEIQGAVNSLASQIASQKALVERNTVAVDQMSTSISSVADVANEKRTVAGDLLQLTGHGKDQVTATESLIAEVGDYVGEIHSMATMINNIAANTNLLAMNAAIEAAHAGSYGRGFAVVAKEIRNLAESTATNAKHIARTLKQLTGKIEEARTAGGNTGQAFQEIESGVATVVSAFQQIATNTEEISRGTGEVRSVSRSLEEISTEIAGSVNEMTYGASEVTAVLTSTRDAASSTRDAMEAISHSAKSLNSATLRISSLSVESNEQIRSILNALADFDARRARKQPSDAIESTDYTDETTGIAAAGERLTLANLMLKHLSWLGTVRSVIDGTAKADPEVLADHTRCDLGRWLTGDARTVIPDEQTYRRLSEKHLEIHGIAREIFGAVSSPSARNESAIEARFRDLLEGTQSVVEILTSLQQTSVVTWSPTLAVDVTAFDNHHKKLLALINRLYQAMKSGQAPAVLEKTFDELLDYTGYHFRAEEKTFEHFGYPECTFHKEQHRALVEKAVALREEMKSGKTLVAVDVMEFLRDWITKHIKGCDRLYSDFFRDKEVNAFLEQLDVERV